MGGTAKGGGGMPQGQGGSAGRQQMMQQAMAQRGQGGGMPMRPGGPPPQYAGPSFTGSAGGGFDPAMNAWKQQQARANQGPGVSIGGDAAAMRAQFDAQNAAMGRTGGGAMPYAPPGPGMQNNAANMQAGMDRSAAMAAGQQMGLNPQQQRMAMMMRGGIGSLPGGGRR